MHTFKLCHLVYANVLKSVSYNSCVSYIIFTTRIKHAISLNIDKINLLKPTGYVMHQQFKIQQLYALPTLYLCVLYLSENKQRLVPLTA
jgi:hypothetical protein